MNTPRWMWAALVVILILPWLVGMFAAVGTVEVALWLALIVAWVVVFVRGRRSSEHAK